MMTNSKARAKWERKKQNFRIRTALLFVIFNVIGIQLIAPGESISTIISEFLIRSTYLNDITGNLSQILIHFGIPNIDSYKIFGFTSKWSVIIIMASITYYFINNKDPFSNIELLRNIKNQQLSPLKFYLNDIKFYAEFLPSNKIADHCDKCDQRDCYNRINQDGDKKNRIWCRLFAILEPNHVEYWHKATHECRKAFYYKYGFLFTSILLTFVILLLYIINKVYFRNSLNIRYEFTSTVIVISLLMYVFFCTVHKIKYGSGGAWRKFADKSDRFFNSDKFDVFFKINVCHTVSNREEIKAIIYLDKYINYMLEDKVLRHISMAANRQRQSRENISRILQFIKQFYYILNNKNISFRTSLFMISENERYMKPYICDKSNLTRFSCISDTNCPEFIKTFFDISGDSVAAKSFVAEQMISTNNVEKVQPESPSPLQSIICYPLILNELVTNELRFQDKSFKRKYGVLCIDCDDSEYFIENNARINRLIISQFASRINYERTISIFYAEDS